MSKNTIFQPVLFSFNFSFYSFIEQDHTFVHLLKTDAYGELEVDETIPLSMTFTTPE